MQIDDSESTFQHIAIAGISFCGSTLLSMILGSLNGVDNIGESHKLVVNLDMTSSTPGADSASPAELIKDCKSCGEECEVYTSEFRHALRDNPTDWYRKIASQRGSSVLVSSDKNYQRLVSKDPLLDLDAIVLFKSPLSAADSFYKKYINPEFSAHKSFDIDYIIRAWLTSYRNFIDEFNNTGHKLFLNFEIFQNNPDLHMSVLCTTLNLDYNTNCLKTLANGQHYFGGNSRVNKPYKNSILNYSIANPDELKLPKQYRDQINNNTELTTVYGLMMERYKIQFSGTTQMGLAEAI